VAQQFFKKNKKKYIKPITQSFQSPVVNVFLAALQVYLGVERVV